MFFTAHARLALNALPAETVREVGVGYIDLPES